MIEGKMHEDFDSAPDLLKDPMIQWQHKYYMPISVAFNVGVPLALGLLTGRVWGMLLWAGLIRIVVVHHFIFFFSSRRRHTRSLRDWSSDVCSSDLSADEAVVASIATDASNIPKAGRCIETPGRVRKGPSSITGC